MRNSGNPVSFKAFSDVLYMGRVLVCEEPGHRDRAIEYQIVHISASAFVDPVFNAQTIQPTLFADFLNFLKRFCYIFAIIGISRYQFCHILSILYNGDLFALSGTLQQNFEIFFWLRMNAPGS